MSTAEMGPGLGRMNRSPKPLDVSEISGTATGVCQELLGSCIIWSGSAHPHPVLSVSFTRRCRTTASLAAEVFKPALLPGEDVTHMNTVPADLISVCTRSHNTTMGELDHATQQALVHRLAEGYLTVRPTSFSDHHSAFALYITDNFVLHDAHHPFMGFF